MKIGQQNTDARFSNCYNSLNFQDNINCNSTRQNVLKWRKTCTALILDLVYFNSPHTKFNNLYPFEGPCRYSSVTVTSVMVFVGPGKVHVSFGPDYYEYCRCGIFGEVCPIPLFGAC